MYILRFSGKAKKQIEKLDSRYQSALEKAFQRLLHNPYIGEPLAGEYKGQWRLRFSQYRIVYQILRGKLIVLIVTVLHRKDVYRS